MWIQIRLLLQEQSDLGPYCLSKADETFQQTTKPDDSFAICALRDKKASCCILIPRNAKIKSPAMICYASKM